MNKSDNSPRTMEELEHKKILPQKRKERYKHQIEMVLRKKMK